MKCFLKQFVRESGQYFTRGFMGGEEDAPLRLYGLDQVCHGILVAIDNIIIVVLCMNVNRLFT